MGGHLGTELADAVHGQCHHALGGDRDLKLHRHLHLGCILHRHDGIDSRAVLGWRHHREATFSGLNGTGWIVDGCRGFVGFLVVSDHRIQSHQPEGGYKDYAGKDLQVTLDSVVPFQGFASAEAIPRMRLLGMRLSALG